jgi:hypothetical protein
MEQACSGGQIAARMPGGLLPTSMRNRGIGTPPKSRNASALMGPSRTRARPYRPGADRQRDRCAQWLYRGGRGSRRDPSRSVPKAMPRNSRAAANGVPEIKR